MEDELKYSSEDVAINRALMLKELGKPIVFVEDEDKDYWYECIFKRLLPDVEVIINPCGGKIKVENAYEYFRDKENNDKYIYVCDGDFDLLIKRERIDSTNFIYLKKYEIESYLVDEKSLLNLLVGRLHGSQRKALEKLNFKVWYSDMVNSWYTLMLAYIIAQKNKVFDIENTNIKPERYIRKNSYIIDENLVNQYIDELKEKLNDLNINYEDERRKIENDIAEMSIVKEEIIKGKYILTSAKRYINWLIKKHKKSSACINNEDAFIILLTSFDVNSLEYVRERIVNALNI